MPKVMVAGTFDIIHPGHIYFFSESKKNGDSLIVVVARDSTSERMKGREPVHNEKMRLEAVKSLKIVDKATLGHEGGSIFDIISEIKPNVICLGYDQKTSKDELEKELKVRGIKAEVIRIGSYMPEVYKSSKILGKR
jgi:FAD synthetase